MSKIVPTEEVGKLHEVLGSQLKQELQDSAELQQTKDDIREGATRGAQSAIDRGVASLGGTGISPVDNALAALNIGSMQFDAMVLAERVKNGDISIDELRNETAKVLEGAGGKGKGLMQDWGKEQARKLKSKVADSIDTPGLLKAAVDMALNVVTFGALSFDSYRELENQYPSDRGDHFYFQMGDLRRMMSFHTYLKGLVESKRPKHRAIFWSIMMVYLLSLFMGFPVPFILTGEDGELVGPATAMEGWDTSLLIFFFILLLLPVGLFKAAVVAVNVSPLGLHGYLWDRIGGGSGKSEPASLTTAQLTTKSRIESLARVNSYIMAACLIFILPYTVFRYAFIKQGPALLRVMIALFVCISAFISLLSIFCLVVLILSLTELLKHNFVGYTETFTLLVKTITMFGFTGGEASVNTHPLVENLNDKLLGQEDSLLSVMSILRTTWMPDYSYLYGVLTAGYVCMAFYIFLAFLNLQVEFEMDLAFETLTFTISTLISLVIVVQPLFAMAVQAEEWVKTTSWCQSFEVQNARMKPQQDPFFWHEHHAKLQKQVTWNIMGYDVVFSSIISTVCSYFGIVWLGMIWPSIQKEMGKL